MHKVQGLTDKVSALDDRVDRFEGRMAEIEEVNARLEEAALTTARALHEISGHWDAVYEAMRRRDVSQQAPE